MEQLQKLRTERAEANAPLNRTGENLLDALNESLVDRELQLKSEKRVSVLPQRKMTCRLLDEVPPGPGAPSQLFEYVAQAHQRQVFSGEFQAKKKGTSVESGSRRKKARKSRSKMKGAAYAEKHQAKLKQGRRRKGRRVGLY